MTIFIARLAQLWRSGGVENDFTFSIDKLPLNSDVVWRYHP
jgi:hypothetical protein